MRHLAFLVLALLLAAWVPAAAQAPAGVDVPGSRFLARLDPEPPPACSAGAEPVRVRWDFSRPAEMRYGLVHETVLNGSANGLRAAETRTVTKGDLVVASQGGGTADFALRPQEVTVTASDRTVNTGGPGEPVVLQGVGEDGRVTGARTEREALLAALFPLPPDPLRTGSSSSRPLQFPYELGPLKVTVQGQAVTRLTGWADIAGVPCARLETSMELTRVQTPPGALGSLHAAGTGRSVFYFDPAARRFVQGSLALRMRGLYGYDRPNPLEGLPPIRLSAEADLDQGVWLTPAPPAEG